MDVQSNVPARACTWIIFQATLSLGLWLGRGFSGMELYTPLQARSPDEYPPVEYYLSTPNQSAQSLPGNRQTHRDVHFIPLQKS